MKPFLILQLRVLDKASDDEFEAFLRWGGLKREEVQRIRMEQEGVPSEIKLEDYSAVIVGGGPTCISDPQEKKQDYEKKMEAELAPLIDQIIEADFPYLGACYGLGALAKQLGGEVSKEKYSESVEAVTLHLTEAAQEDPLTKDLPKDFRAFGGHKEACQDVPPGATLLASSDACPVHLIRVKKNIYATQFHPELDSDGIILRINTYKDYGYFPPEDAEPLIEKARQETVSTPGAFLKNFVDRYRQS